MLRYTTLLVITGKSRYYQMSQILDVKIYHPLYSHHWKKSLLSNVADILDVKICHALSH